MQFLPLFTLAAAGACAYWAVRLARQDEDSQHRAEMGSRLLIAAAAAAVILLVFTSQIWYVPATVPHAVSQEASGSLPDWFEVMDQQESASPLQWRVEFVGRRDPGGPASHQLTYTYNRLTGADRIQLGQTATFGHGSRVIIYILVAVALGVVLYSVIPLIFGQKCPNCRSKPFDLLQENQLLSSEIDMHGGSFPIVCEGHFHCKICGFNQMRVYEGSKLSHGGGHMTDPVEMPGMASLISDDVDDRQLSMDEETWKEQVSQLKQQREREWFDADE